MKRLGAIWSRFANALADSNHARSLLALSAAGVLVGLISGLQQMLGLGEWASPYFRWAGLFALFLICACILLWLFELAWASLKPPPMNLAIPPSRFYCRILDSHSDSVRLNSSAVVELFPDSTPSIEKSISAQQINNQRLVGILERDTEEIAGWVSMWPVKSAIAGKIEGGDLADDEIPIDQVVPVADNARTRHLVILALGIREQYRGPRLRLFPKLANAALWHIHDSYFDDDEKALQIIAIAYSEEGERMCRMLDMRPNGKTARYANGALKPVFLGRFRRPDIRQKLREATA